MAGVIELFRRYGPLMRPVAILTLVVVWATAFVKVITDLHAIPWSGGEEAIASVVLGLCFGLGFLLVRWSRKKLNADPNTDRTWRQFVHASGSWILLTTPSLVAAVILLSRSVSTPPVEWAFWLIVGGFVLLWLIVIEFGRYSLRVAAVVFLASMLLLVASIGRDELAPDERPTSAGVARTTATALDARLAAISKQLAADTPDGVPPAGDPLRLDEVQTAIGRACEDAAGSTPHDVAVAEECKAIERKTSLTPVALARRVALTSVATANASVKAADAHAVAVDNRGVIARKQAAQGQKEAKQEQEEAAKALAAATKATEPTAPDVTLVDALEEGANEVIAVLPGVSSGPANVDVAAIGWMILAVLALLYYRALEIRAIKYGIGPVSVEAGKSLKTDDKDSPLLAAFEARLLQNVSEPGAVPESEASVNVTELIGEFSNPTTFLTKFAAAALKVLRPAASYTVIVDCLPDHVDPVAPKADASVGATAEVSAHSGKSVVVLRVIDARNRTPLLTRRVKGDTPEEALRNAAFAAAGWVIHHSKVVPKWADWSPDAASALAAHTELPDALDTEGLDDEERAAPTKTDQLEQALQHAPRSGLLAVKVGNAKSVQGEFGAALALYARCSAQYSHYLAGRYRTAVGLSLVSSNPEKHWQSLPPSERQAIVWSLKGAHERAHLESLDPGCLLHAEGDAWTTSACQVAQAHLYDLEDRMRFTSVLCACLRREERSYWLAHLWTEGGERKRKRSVYKTARITVERRGGLVKKTEKQQTEHDEPQARQYMKDYSVNATALYNLACWILVGSETKAWERRMAMELLEQSRDAPGGARLKKKWLQKDPDLEELSGDARFMRFLETIVP